MSSIVSASKHTEWELAPPGPTLARCVDVIDLGPDPKDVLAGKKEPRHRWQIAFLLEKRMSDGKPFLLRTPKWYGDIGPRARLGLFLEAWRGRPFTDEERRGFNLERLINAPAYLNIVHQPVNGQIYANIASVMQAPKDAPLPPVGDYVRVRDREQKPAVPYAQQYAGGNSYAPPAAPVAPPLAFEPEPAFPSQPGPRPPFDEPEDDGLPFF